MSETKLEVKIVYDSENFRYHSENLLAKILIFFKNKINNNNNNNNNKIIKIKIKTFFLRDKFFLNKI